MTVAAVMTAGPRQLTAGIEELKRDLNGKVVLPQDAAYESARKIWNGMVDKRPAVIVRCLHTSDVVRALNFARAQLSAKLREARVQSQFEGGVSFH
jgi:hypothetical protein